MNRLTMRRRWLIARPWLKDASIAMGFIATIMGAMWAMNNLAFWCQQSGFCQ